MPYLVYMHTSPSGKKYIGITSLSMKARIGSSANRYKWCPLFYRAILKYGWESFSTQIVATGLDKAAAEAMECLLIEQYQTRNPAVGYNVSLGGGAYGGHSPETKAKMSRSRKGKPGKQKSQECKDKMAQKHMNTGNPRYGKTVSPETKELLRQKANERKAVFEPNTRTTTDYRKRNTSGSVKASRKVICVETGEVFDTSISAAKSIGVNPSCIRHVMCGRGRTTGGYHWERFDHEQRPLQKKEPIRLGGILTTI